MNTSDYIEQAISKLLEQDAEIKLKFYSHATDPISENLHRQHHKIKQWTTQLSQIRDEIRELTTADISSSPSSDDVIFHISRRDMPGKAHGIVTTNGFKVLTGSYISPNIVSGMYEIVKQLRRRHSENIDSSNCLKIDIAFENPGQAARFVTGKQVNGIEEWKTASGMTLKEYQADKSWGREYFIDNNPLHTSTEYSNKKPKSIILFNQKCPVSTWRDVLVNVCEVLYQKYPDTMKSLPYNSRINSNRRATFALSKEAIKVSPIRLSFGLWVEANQSAETVMRLCSKLLLLCGCQSNDLSVDTNNDQF